MHPKLDNLYMVPEYSILECAAQFIDEDNIFQRCLAEAMEYKVAGLSPIYMTDKNQKNLFVTTKERLMKRLH